MNAYVERVIEEVKVKHASEPEFVQTVEEVFSSISPVIDAHPEYEKVDLLGRMVEPERMFTFRVVWMDDNGQKGKEIPLFLLRFAFPAPFRQVQEHRSGTKGQIQHQKLP